MVCDGSLAVLQIGKKRCFEEAHEEADLQRSWRA